MGAAKRGQRATTKARIEALAERYRLSDLASARLCSLLDLLVGDPQAPTSVHDPAKVIDDHLSDSLVALDLVETRSSTKITDLGAGAGLPGLPLAIALASTEVALVESSIRKCAFIERAVALCEIPNARVVHSRAESWTEGFRTSDLVTARALASPAVVAEYAAPLLRIGGTLVVWRGRRDPEAEAAGARAAAELGLEVQEPLPVSPYPGAENRHLQLMLKVKETPSEFPRRPGVARKRPLGGRPRP